MALRYRLSFTTGGLLAREAAVAFPIYLQLREWGTVRQSLEAENLLQSRTVASSRRLGRELVQRLSMLRDVEIELLGDSTATERAHLMWVAACRRYDLIGEFAEEVVREKYMLLNPSLAQEDFDRFVRSKTLWHDELSTVADSTLRRLRSNLFLMLREAGLVSNDGRIIPCDLSPRIAGALAIQTPNDIRFFPTTEKTVRWMPE